MCFFCCGQVVTGSLKDLLATFRINKFARVLLPFPLEPMSMIVLLILGKHDCLVLVILRSDADAPDPVLVILFITSKPIGEQNTDRNTSVYLVYTASGA